MAHEAQWVREVHTTY